MNNVRKPHTSCRVSDNGCFSVRRPLIPVSKLTVSESYENYISRSYQVTKDILSDCKNTGKTEPESSWSGCWRCAVASLFMCLCLRPDGASRSGFHSLHRKQRADCGPRVFPGGLHAPAAGPQPTELQGLHPSRPKGLLDASLFICSL